MKRYNSSAIKAKHTEVDGITFDSGAESICYRYLKTLDPQIKCQTEIPLIPDNNKFGIPPKRWKCDFYSPRYEVYIEYKGIFDKEFRTILQLLAYRQSTVLERLLIISNSDVTVRALKKFCPYLRVSKVTSCFDLEKLIKQVSP